MSSRVTLTGMAVAVLIAVGGVLGVSEASHQSPPPADVAAQLAALPVAPAHEDGYHREAFGSGWIDADHDGCDTRAEALERDLVDPVVQHTPSCRVLSGGFTDPYTGISGQADASRLDIDHIVALEDAWASGAWDDHAWTTARRVAYANDLDDLQASGAAQNRSKGSRGPAQWRPVAPERVCAYARKYISIKARWGLSVTPADHDALMAMLGGC